MPWRSDQYMSACLCIFLAKLINQQIKLKFWVRFQETNTMLTTTPPVPCMCVRACVRVCLRVGWRACVVGLRAWLCASECMLPLCFMFSYFWIVWPKKKDKLKWNKDYNSLCKTELYWYTTLIKVVFWVREGVSAMEVQVHRPHM